MTYGLEVSSCNPLKSPVHPLSEKEQWLSSEISQVNNFI